jgi:hypothetical protein
MAISLVKFGRTVRLHPRPLASLDPRAELFDAGSGPIRWDPPQPTFVWMTRHSAGMRLIAQAVHPPSPTESQNIRAPRHFLLGATRV